MLFAQGSIVVLLIVLLFLLPLVLSLAAAVRNLLPWFQARLNGVPVNLPQIIGMRFRKVNPNLVVRTLVLAKQAGVELSCDEVERAYLRGADLRRIAPALVRARNEGKAYTFQQLVDSDLEGTTG